MRRTLLVFASMSGAWSALPLAGQSPIPIRLTVSIENGGTRTLFANQGFWVTSLDGGDSALVTTTANGEAQFRLASGRYRIKSNSPAVVDKKAYTWNVPFTVSPAASIDLRLNEHNAAAGTSSSQPVAAQQTSPAGPVLLQPSKDPRPPSQQPLPPQSQVAAQQSVPPGLTSVQLTVTVERQGVRRPVGNHRLWIRGSEGSDSAAVTTNTNGAADFLLTPAQYIIHSDGPAAIDGLRYSWDVTFAVAAETRIELRLSERNADVSTLAPTPLIPSASSAGRTVIMEPEKTGPGALIATTTKTLRPGQPGYKDSGIAMLISVFIPGGGHLYTGETGKGAGILLAYVLNAAVAINALEQCSVSYDCSEARAGMASVAVLALWIYGIADAGPSARRKNIENAHQGLSVVPLPQGRVGVGLMMHF